MHILSGIIGADRGTVLMNNGSPGGGFDLTGLSAEQRTTLRRDRIGFVFQSFHLVPRLTAAENIALPMVLAALAPREREARVREALAGEDDSEDDDWAVYVRVDTIDDETSAPARALVERFEQAAAERGGWLDEDVAGRF